MNINRIIQLKRNIIFPYSSICRIDDQVHLVCIDRHPFLMNNLVNLLPNDHNYMGHISMVYQLGDNNSLYIHICLYHQSDTNLKIQVLLCNCTAGIDLKSSGKIAKIHQRWKITWNSTRPSDWTRCFSFAERTREFYWTLAFESSFLSIVRDTFTAILTLVNRTCWQALWPKTTFQTATFDIIPAFNAFGISWARIWIALCQRWTTIFNCAKRNHCWLFWLFIDGISNFQTK